MQDEAHDFADGLQGMSLAGKEVALFGCGDETMADTFCDGVAELMKYVEPTGARIIGSFDVSGYDFPKAKPSAPMARLLGCLSTR